MGFGASRAGFREGKDLTSAGGAGSSEEPPSPSERVRTHSVNHPWTSTAKSSPQIPEPQQAATTVGPGAGCREGKDLASEGEAGSSPSSSEMVRAQSRSDWC